MSIQSTMQVSREWVINRITEIYPLIQDSNYRALENSAGCEPDVDIKKYVDWFNSDECEYDIDLDRLAYWTNKMLGDVVDEPFFRLSMFENYWVVDEVDDDEW